MARSAAALALLSLLSLAALASFASASTPEGEAFLKANALKEGVVVLPSGLQYKARRTSARARAFGRDARCAQRRGAGVCACDSANPGTRATCVASCARARAPPRRAAARTGCRGAGHVHAAACAPCRGPPPLWALRARARAPNQPTSPPRASPQVLRAGAPRGKKPLASTPCSCHYAGTLIDGTEFDSSYKRGAPTTFAPNQVIKGWTEAMQLMSEGAKWELYIPSELAYGNSQRGAHITPGAVLLFQLELLEVKGAAQPLPPADEDNVTEL
jgi:FKBP-type peptidyl-prolyl cis-trans isomerase FklB